MFAYRFYLAERILLH